MTTPTEQVPAPITRHSERRVRELEVIASDRTQLVNAANCFVGHMVMKRVLPVAYAGMLGHEVELSKPEEAAYDAALDFLRRQFALGFCAMDVQEKRVESELTMEFSKDASSEPSPVPRPPATV